MVAQLGLVAGGLSDGTIGIWNPDAIIKAQQGAEDVPDALVATLAGHEGAVRPLTAQTVGPVFMGPIMSWLSVL